ncbi:MAG: hypothetical protein ACLQB4_19620 [Beijerinckiaceae bacterium]
MSDTISSVAARANAASLRRKQRPAVAKHHNLSRAEVDGFETRRDTPQKDIEADG